MNEHFAVVYNGITWHFHYAEIYCPRCGHRGVWLEGDDFYVGATGYCLACQHTHRCAGDFTAFEAFEHAVQAAIQAHLVPQEERR